jgi:hypothetical protein
VLYVRQLRIECDHSTSSVTAIHSRVLQSLNTKRRMSAPNYQHSDCSNKLLCRLLLASSANQQKLNPRLHANNLACISPQRERRMQPPFCAERVETDGELHVTRARRSTTQPLRTAHQRRQCDTRIQHLASHSLTKRPARNPRLPQHLHVLGCRAANPRSRRTRFSFRTSIAFGGADQHSATEHYGAPVANLSRRIDWFRTQKPVLGRGIPGGWQMRTRCGP